MSAQQLKHPRDDGDPPEWFFRLGLHEPDQCAGKLARALVDDPFYVIGFTAVAATYFRDGFGQLVEWLAEREPVLQDALHVVAAALTLPIVDESLQLADEADLAALPKWLRHIDQLECTGIMRRYDQADHSASSYLIEALLPDGHVSTARLSIAHDGGGDRVCEFWTMAFTLSEAARFYRKRYATDTTRPYRHVKLDTACRRILDALHGSFENGGFFEDCDAPIPWPQNAAVLFLMLRPLVAQLEDTDARPPK